MLEPQLSAQILDCFYYVYRERGSGFLENVYANSLAVELEYRGVPIRREVPIELLHRGKSVGTYRIDLLVGNKILVEVKSTLRLGIADERQLVNYLKATPIELGFLLHFGPEPKFIRRVLTNSNKHSGLTQP